MAASHDVAQTGASVILDALEASGITHLFVNLGSDHPAFLSAFVSRQRTSKIRVITSPNEMNALSAASAFAQVTGGTSMAAVLVHVECGTQGLAGAVHNVSKGRIPVLILAGTVPITQEGELMGSRNEYIHWIQDVPDQRAIVRQYMKYEHEIRSALNATQLVLRAMQFSRSSPQGPSYLITAREVLEQHISTTVEQSSKLSCRADKTTAIEFTGLSPTALNHLTDALLSASYPLIVTSYCGRTAEGFEALKRLAELLVIPVHENAPIYNNFPTTSFLHQGHQWNGGGQLPALQEADVVLVIDSDVPWIGAQSKPSDTARIFHIDVDPLKEDTTLWYLPCEKRWKCDSPLALTQLVEGIQAHSSFESPEVRDLLQRRKYHLEDRFNKRQERLLKLESPEETSDNLTVPFFMSRLRDAFGDLQVVGLNESTTNLGNVADHLRHDRPLSLIGSGGGALGWYSGAAVGSFLALQEKENKAQQSDPLIVTFTGDGTWLFGVPSCAYWMAKKYQTPFLTILWNNGGWASPKNACIRLHPETAAAYAETSRDAGDGVTNTLGEELFTAITPSPNFGKIAEGAGDAWWVKVERRQDVDSMCQEAIRVVREEKRCALIEVAIDRI